MPVRYPDEAAGSRLLPEVTFPAFYDIEQDPESPHLEDVYTAAREAVTELQLSDVPTGGTIALGLGSRGITDVVPAARGVVEELQSRGYEVIAMPAMGSHGGASADGQRETLRSLGLDEETLGCPIDARMETVTLGVSALGHEVHFAEAALQADAVCVLNRVKAHTNFFGTFESGLTKMTCVGFGKQPGAQSIHERAIADGYEDTFRATYDVIRESVTLIGGVAIVENFDHETAEVTGLPASALPDGEGPLLERAYEYMPTLPFEELDVLIVDEIGKDVSGAGMDPNIIGRFRLLNMEDPEDPDIKRIYVRGLTDTTHGNAMGIGIADVTLIDVIESIDLEQVYANAITSGSIEKAALPLALPTEELAFRTALSTIGAWDPDSVRIAWIRDTNHLREIQVSAALAEEAEHRPDLTVRDSYRLEFEDGDPVLRPR